MKVVRTIVYDGPEDWIRFLLGKSLADGEHRLGGVDKSITLTTVAHVFQGEEQQLEGIWPVGRPIDPQRKV